MAELTGLDFANNAVSTGGNIALGLIGNEGKNIQGRYQTELQKLLNDKTLTESQFKVKLAELNAERDLLLAQAKREARNDYLKIAAVAGVFALALLAVWWTIRRERKD